MNHTREEKRYTREELLQLPVKRRKEFLKQKVQEYIQQILNSAGRGDISFFIDLTDNDKPQSIKSYPPPPAPPTIDELRETLQEYFPDSKVSYEERWVEVPQVIKNQKIQQHKKGITVNWS